MNPFQKLYESWKAWKQHRQEEREEARRICTYEERLKESEDFLVHWDAVQKLCKYYWKKKGWRRIAEFLEIDYNPMRESAMGFLRHRTGQGEDIRQFQEVLERLLNRPSKIGCADNVWLLVSIYFRHEDWIALESLLRFPDPIVPGPALVGLREEAFRCLSLERLERTEQLVASLVPPSLDRHDPRKIAKRQRQVEFTAQVLQSIAYRKSQLAKERDGELLAGETIKLPPSGRRWGVYRTGMRRA